MTHMKPSCVVEQLSFCPFEDVLGYGHTSGFTSIVIPGSGEPNYDSFEANPFETNKQRREREVHQLLEKVQPEMISLHGSLIGKVKDSVRDMHMKEMKRNFEANNQGTFTPKEKSGNEDAMLRRKLKKNANIIDPRKVVVKDKLKKLRKQKKEELKPTTDSKPVHYNPLSRFKRKDL